MGDVSAASRLHLRSHLRSYLGYTSRLYLGQVLNGQMRANWISSRPTAPVDIKRMSDALPKPYVWRDVLRYPAVIFIPYQVRSRAFLIGQV